MIVVSPTRDAIERAIHGWISTSTGIDAVWADSPGPELKRPYALMKIIAGPTPRSFMAETNYVVEDGCRKKLVTSSQLCTLNVQFFAEKKAGSDACQVASNYIESAQFGLDFERYNAYLRDVGIAVYDIQGVQDISALDGVEINSRASVDFLFRYKACYHVPLSEYGGWIEKVGFTLEAAPADEKTFLVEKATCQQPEP